MVMEESVKETGSLHSNKSHTKTSVKLFHLKELSSRAKAKAKK
jgi:hypothetical protein